MSLTRYYILEGDTTTANGVVQKTSNPAFFQVHGKQQSYIGDDVFCPACNTMGKLQAQGSRLNTTVNGNMPALNDDLCICQCSPSPRLIHSQTTFVQKIDKTNEVGDNSNTSNNKNNQLYSHNVAVQFMNDDGILIVNTPYVAKNKTTGQVYTGTTDEEGFTARFFSNAPEEYEIKLDLDWQENNHG